MRRQRSSHSRARHRPDSRHRRGRATAFRFEPNRPGRSFPPKRDLKHDEFRFAPPLNQSPFIPAKAGIQWPGTLPRLGPRFRGGRTELRGDSNSSHLALGPLALLVLLPLGPRIRATACTHLRAHMRMPPCGWAEQSHSVPSPHAGEGQGGGCYRHCICLLRRPTNMGPGVLASGVLT
jgi:hypothetical protein